SILCTSHRHRNTLPLHDALPIWPLVDTDVRRRQIPAHAFDAAPLKIQSRRIGRFDQVDFLARTRADVTDENPSARRVVRHPVRADRKSTRLNSSHLGISYAVFGL